PHLSIAGMTTTTQLRYDPEFDAATAQMRASMANMPKTELHDIETRRQRVLGIFGMVNSQLPEVPHVTVTEHKLKSFDGVEISVHQFRKQENTTTGSALLHIHGGGMIAGSAMMLDRLLAQNVSTTGVQIFSIEYRLAPEVTGTVLVQDCYATLLWLHENASQFGVDKARIGLHGESAGGGIAAGVALMARDKKLSPPLAKQILIYPMIDDKNVHSIPSMADKVIWTHEDNITGWTALLGDKIGTDQVSPYCAPIRAADLSGLPSTYMDVGGLDLFVEEDALYAERLVAANVEVEFHLFPGVPHSWQTFSPDIAITKMAVAARLRAMMSF
ncbi:hypothetical protein LTR66_014568, partial [Elasticomyces elasticus]